MTGHSQTNGLLGYYCLADAGGQLVQLAVRVVSRQDQCQGARPTPPGQPVGDDGNIWHIFHGFQGILDGQGQRVPGGSSLALNQSLYRIGMPGGSRNPVDCFGWEKDQLPSVHGGHRAPHDIVRVV